MGSEFKRDPAWKRQHLVSLPAVLHAEIKKEAGFRGLTIGEMARSIIRCWVDQKPPPQRTVEPIEAPGAAAAPEEPAPAPRRSDGRPALVGLPSAPDRIVETPEQELERRKEELFFSPLTPPVPQQLPDPDFDSPDALKEAMQLLGRDASKDEAPF